MSRILVLLLPEALERFEHRQLVERLMRADGVVVCDPPRTSYEKIARLPDGVGAGLAHKIAKRLRKRLPGQPCAVAIFDPAQYPLARGVLIQVEECELWYHPPAEERLTDERLEELHALAVKRADVVFDGAEELVDPLTALELSSLPERGGGLRARRR